MLGPIFVSKLIINGDSALSQLSDKPSTEAIAGPKAQKFSSPNHSRREASTR